MRDKVTTNVSDAAMQEIADFCEANQGAQAELIKRVNRRTRKKWNRENFWRWLHPNPALRSQPLLGIGLLIIEEGRKLIAKGNGQKPCQPERKAPVCRK